MDLGSLSFAAVLIGGIALCYFALKVRTRQISYEGELLVETSPEFIDWAKPAVGDAVYYFFELASRRDPLGTTQTIQSNPTAWAMGDRLYTQKVLGVISAINSTNLHIETYGFEGGGIWFVVDTKGQATGTGCVNTPLILSLEGYDQVHFTSEETGPSNAILRGFRKLE